MTLHTKRGTRFSMWVDDGFGNLSRIDFTQVVTRITSGWPEL
jgi:hypothetical protein